MLCMASLPFILFVKYICQRNTAQYKIFMEKEEDIKSGFERDGFAVINDVFSYNEMESISGLIESVSVDKPAFRKSSALFAIRQVLKEIPGLRPLVFTSRLCQWIHQLFGNGYFVVKSIYFDKPATSNWFVAYHQDLTISVDRKIDLDGFSSWTVKQNQYAVQPPVGILQHNFTIRIHLDDTDKNNGALKIIPGSHLKGILRMEALDGAEEKEQICEVKKGGIMLMRPLLVHASNRTTNATRRRVIHIEFSSCSLPLPLQWSEQLGIKFS